MKYHPDKVQGVGFEERFREITTAYEVLGNPRLRRMYDRGLLSNEGDEVDASVHYPTESSSEPLEPMSPEELERRRKSMKSFDRWSQDQISRGFKRVQDAKRESGLKENYKQYRSATMGEMQVLVLILVVILLVASISLEVPKFFDSSRSKNDNSNSDKRKKS